MLMNKSSIIYEPQGKAAEYAPLALNLYRGCSHGCTYCYAPDFTRTKRELFFNPSWVHLLGCVSKDGYTPDLKRLEREAQKLAGDPRQILLSFTSDPYQPKERKLGITRNALIILKRHRLHTTILTKSGRWGLCRDYNLLQMDFSTTWAVTLTHDRKSVSLEWEPQAAAPMDRILSLSLAKDLGLKTWVSFEPVIDPEAVYRLLDATHEFVDHYKVGKLNYHPRALEIDWRRFRGEMEERLTKLGKPYYIKKDLLEALA